jgi:hypothetical protein
VAKAICVKVAMGSSLRAVCREVDEEGKALMPKEETVRSWLLDFPEFANAFGLARKYQADHIFDEILDLAHGLIRPDMRETGVIYKEREIQAAVRVLQWTVSKLKPEEYGDRASPDGRVAISINTTMDMGKGTKQVEPTIGGKTIYSIAAPREETALERIERSKVDGKAKKKKPRARRNKQPKQAVGGPEAGEPVEAREAGD